MKDTRFNCIHHRSMIMLFPIPDSRTNHIRFVLSLIIRVMLILFIPSHADAAPESPQRSSQEEILVEDSAVKNRLTQFGNGNNAWGLLNGDDFLDLVVAGYSSTHGINLTTVYFFNQDGQVDSAQYLQPGSISNPPLGITLNTSLADVDNDGNLDILVTGGGESFLFKNSGGNFSHDEDQDIPALLYSTARWGDYDNDGDSDLFLMGTDTRIQHTITRIYKNDPPGTLKPDETQILANIANGDAAWGDYDKDGDLDLVVAGQSAATGSNLMKLYKNEPTGRLIEDTNQDLTGLKAASLTWEDLDSDGDLDLVTTGWEGDTTGLSVTRIYINEPVGTLSLSPHQITFGVSYGTVDFGDFDNDGDPDLVIAGADSVSRDAEVSIHLAGRIYQNDGSGMFELNQAFPGGMSAAWGDYDSDNDLDLYLMGYSSANPEDREASYASIFENTGSTENSHPDPPGSLSSFAVGNQVILSWISGSDEETEPEALVYNIQMFTRSNGDTTRILSEAVPLGSGNVGQALIKVFQDIPPGTYYWRIQTIDQGLERSVWSEQDKLSIPRLVESIQSLSGTWYNAASWNDYNNDGTLDLAITGISFDLGGTATRLFKNDPPGILTQDLTQNIQPVWGGSMIWADYNNDGALDYILSGMAGLTPTTYLYYWDENSRSFELDNSQDLTQVWGGSQIVDWVDYDNDGDLDLIMGGCLAQDCSNQPVLDIYQNNSSVFVADTLQDIAPMLGGVVSSVDFNRDGYMDLFAAGFDSLAESHLRIYLNDSSGVFKEHISLEDEGIASGSAAWGDYDSDGFPDLAITGLYNNSERELKIFRNNNGVSLERADSMNGVFYGYLDWGDYDNDGDLDLALTGYTEPPEDPAQEVGSQQTTRVYRNNGAGSLMEDDSLHLRWAGASTVLWADYDADGDLDLLVAGTDTSGGDFSRVYDNLESINNVNYPPLVPSGVRAIVDTVAVTLEWDESTDRVNPDGGYTESEALTYNLQVGSSYDGHEIVSGNINYGFGSHGSATRMLLRDLEDGRYYWKVQAVDNGFVRSEWSPVQSFYFDSSPPEIDTVSANFRSGDQINIVIIFWEAYGMDNSISPVVSVLHPEGIIPDTLLVEQQSYSGNVWSGGITLPAGFTGQAIKILISDAKDLSGYTMVPAVIYRTPSKVISARGGTIISDDGKVTLELSPNAVVEDVTIRILEEESITIEITETELLGSAYRIEPAILTLEKPSILSFLYNFSDFSDGTVEPDSLFIGQIISSDSVHWIGGTVTTTENSLRISASIDTLGYYGVLKNRGLSTIGEYEKLKNLTCQPRIFSPQGKSFSSRTNIVFDLKEQADVTVRIFNPAGRLKRVVSDGEMMNVGSNTISWNGKDEKGRIVASGLYIVAVEAGGKIVTTTVGVLNR